MKIRALSDASFSTAFDTAALHPLQSWEWGEFRKKTGVRVVRYGVFAGKRLVKPFQITIHPLPFLPFTVGYLPKSYLPDDEQAAVLREVARAHRCIFIKVEPKVEVVPIRSGSSRSLDSIEDDSTDLRSVSVASNGVLGEKFRELGFVPGRALFTKYTFVLDVTKSEEALLAQMKSKTRYNVGYAARKGVTVAVDNSDKAFTEYLRLTQATTERQGFYAHNPRYHSAMWETLKARGKKHEARSKSSSLTAHLIKATYKGETLVTWMLFQFLDTLYYPYGASSDSHRNLMASNLVMWEAIRYAKQKNLKYFDMWGALGPDPNPHDPWHGFHRFKEGYGARHVEYIGTYDYVARPLLYRIFRVMNGLRWFILRAMRSSA